MIKSRLSATVVSVSIPDQLHAEIIILRAESGLGPQRHLPTDYNCTSENKHGAVHRTLFLGTSGHYPIVFCLERVILTGGSTIIIKVKMQPFQDHVMTHSALFILIVLTK